MALQPLKTFLKEFLRKQKTTGPGRVLTQTEIDQRQEFLDKFLQYADEKFSGNFSAAAESLGESRERIRGFFQRQAGESRAYGKIAKGGEMQTTIEVPKKLIPYTEATTNVKYNQNFFKNKIKDFDKTKFYTPKDLANILGFDVSNKAVLDNFTADLKRFGVSTKQKTGQQKLYNLSSAANELTEGYQKKLVKGDRLSGSRRSEVIYKLDKPLNNYFSAFRNRLRNISKEKDVYVPSAGEDVGHPLSVKITDKFPKLTKNSNINKINTLVYQDPIVNRDVLVKTGYEAKHENLLKRLNKLLNKPLKEKDVLELQNVKQELNNLHTEVVDNIKELSKTDNYFKGQEQRIAKIDINIPEVGKKFKSEDLFVDMSNVNPAYKVGYIDNINPNAKFFNDLTKKQKQQYHSNVVDQNKNNLQRFYKEAGFDQESIEDLKDAIDFGTDSKLPLYFLSGTGVTAATGVAADDQTDLLEKGDIDYGDPETWNMKVGQFIEESPKLSATAAAATPLLTKPGRKLYGQAAKQILRGAGTPLGLVMANLGFGVDPASSLDRAVLGTELALSPFAVKEAAKFGPTAQRILNLGLSPTMALRAARFASPLGIATLVGEGGYQFYQALEDEKARIAAMSPEERQMFEEEQTAAAYMGEAEGFAYGGRVGLEEGGPPDPSKRKFIKRGTGILGALTAIGTGAIKLAPEISKVKEIIGSLNVLPKNAPEWLLPLYKKIKSLGKESKVEPTKEGGTGYKVTDLKTEDGSYKIVENEKTGEVVISADTSAGVNEGPLDFIVRPRKITGVNSDGTPIVDPGEFKMVENRAVGRMTSPEDYELDIDEYVTNNLDDLGSDWHAVEEFATGKTDKTLQAKKLEGKKFIEENPGEDVVNRQGEYDYMGDDSMMEDY